jgi:hypothetical protein
MLADWILEHYPDNPIKIKPEGSKKTIRLDVCITSHLTEEQVILKIIEALGEEIVITPADKDNSKAVDIDSLEAFDQIYDLCGTVNFSSHKQMKEVIESSWEISLNASLKIKEMYLKGIAKNNQQ